jgi:hypothetical protein
MIVMSIFGKGGGTNLAFRSQSGEVLHANMVNPGVANEIIALLQGQ